MQRAALTKESLFFLVTAILVVAFIVPDYLDLWGALGQKPPFGHDFGCVYNMGSMLVQGKRDIYNELAVNQNAERLNLRFVNAAPYPPFAIAFFLPLALLSFDAARMVMFVGSQLLILGSLYLLYGWLRPLHNRSFWRDAAWLLPLSMAFSPTLDLLFSGQPDAVVLWFLCLAIRFGVPLEDTPVPRWAPHLAAFALALTINLKLPLLIFLGYFVLQRRWSAAISTSIWTVVLFLLPCLFWGWGLYPAYLQRFHEIVGPDHPESWNQSIAGLLGRTFIGVQGAPPFLWLPNLVKPVYRIVALVLTIGASLLCARRMEPQGRAWQISLLTVSIFLIGAISEPHHHVWAFIPLIALFLCYREHRLYLWWMVPIYAGLAVFDGEVTGRGWLYLLKQEVLLDSLPVYLFLATWATLAWQIRREPGGAFSESHERQRP